MRQIIHIKFDILPNISSFPSDCTSPNRPKVKLKIGEEIWEESALSEKMKLLVSLLALLQLFHAGLHIVSRVELKIGVSLVYTVYENMIALVLSIPTAYFLEKTKRPFLTFSLVGQFFLLAFCGITVNKGFYLLGVYYTSPTFASAVQNSVPVITFFMSSAPRNWATVVGIIASVGGATINTLYKGPPLLHPLHHSLGSSVEEYMFFSSKKTQNWTMGCICLIVHCLSRSGWKVLQNRMPSDDSEDVLQVDSMEEHEQIEDELQAHAWEKHPAKFTLTFVRLFGMIQFLVIAAFVETDIEHWKIQSRGELFTILYGGIVVSWIAFFLQNWCIQKGGPILVAVFQPVQRVLVAIMAYLILGDPLYSGGLIGAVLIMLGLCSISLEKSEKRGENTPNEGMTEHLLDEGNRIISQ